MAFRRITHRNDAGTAAHHSLVATVQGDSHDEPFLCWFETSVVRVDEMKFETLGSGVVTTVGVVGNELVIKTSRIVSERQQPLETQLNSTQPLSMRYPLRSTVAVACCSRQPDVVICHCPEVTNLRVRAPRDG